METDVNLVEPCCDKCGAPIIQAHADTNGVPPQSETKAQPPLPSGCNPPGLYETHTIGGSTSDRGEKR